MNLRFVIVALSLLTACSHLGKSSMPSISRVPAATKARTAVSKAQLSARRPLIRRHVERPLSSANLVEKTRSDIRACLEAACGPAAELWTSSNMRERPGKELLPEKIWQEEFEPRARKLWRAQKEHHLASVERLQASLQAKIPENISHDDLNLLKFLKLLEMYETSVFDVKSNGSMTLNEGKTKVYLNTIASPAEREAMGAFLKAAEENVYREVNLVTLGKLGSRLFLRSNDDFGNALKTDAEGLFGTWSLLKLRFSPGLIEELMSGLDSDLILKALNGDELSLVESEAYVDQAAFIQLFRHTLLNKGFMGLLDAVPLDLEREIRRVQATNMLRGYEKYTEDEVMEELKEDCLPQIATGLAFTASGLRLTQAQKMIVDVKRAATKVAARFLSSEKAAGELLEQIQFVPPETRADVLKRVRGGFTKSEKRLNKRPNTELAILWDSIWQSYSTSTAPKLSELHYVTRACRSIKVRTTSDASLWLYKRVHYSWFSANYPNYGASNVAHEIGHIVYGYAVSKQNEKTNPDVVLVSHTPDGFAKSRKCIRGRNPEYRVSGVKVESDEESRWLEEDWADHYSNLVLDEMLEQKSEWAESSLTSCGIQDVEKGRYINLTLNSSSDDHHSTDVVRLLLEGVDRNLLPSACRNLLITAWPVGSAFRCH